MTKLIYIVFGTAILAFLFSYIVYLGNSGAIVSISQLDPYAPALTTPLIFAISFLIALLISNLAKAIKEA
jgi:DNA-binding beta-propeller fold protein YncE